MKERDFWSDEDKKKVALDSKARSILIIALPDGISHPVINYQTAKEIWDTLVVLFEGTAKVKKNKRSLLIQQYKTFTSKLDESLTETYERFNCLLNDLRLHGTEYDNEDMLIKFIRSLSSEWDGIMVAIRKTKNIKMISLQALYKKSLTHELKVQQR